MDPVEARMRAAFELHDLAVAMRREALAREYPDEDAAQIEARLCAWLLRSDPPHGFGTAQPSRSGERLEGAR